KIIKQALQVIEERRCHSCHVIDGQGGYIKNRQELSKKEFSHLLPPSLDGEGDMVQPQWLFSFLKDPTPVRPWLTIRMPTFAFQDNEVEALVQFFSLSSGRETLFDAEENRGDDKKEIESGKQIFTLLKCDSCHGGKTNGKMKPGDIGPDLSLAKHRLRAKWVKRWLEDPMSIKKGTRMPTNWIKVQRRGKTRYILPPSLQSILGGDVKKQISAVTAYLLTL
ncbi:MAG: c-type cytochrome, partial [Nitrospinota bacterium]